MPLKPVLWITLAVLAGGWVWRDSEPLRGWLHPLRERSPPLPIDAGAARSGGPSSVQSPQRSARARKCLRGNEVLYTNDSCPQGTREQLLSGGTLTVVPATPVESAAAPAAAASKSSVRDLLGAPDDGQLRERQVERATR